jgi:hypothetical protein
MTPDAHGEVNVVASVSSMARGARGLCFTKKTEACACMGCGKCVTSFSFDRKPAANELQLRNFHVLLTGFAVIFDAMGLRLPAPLPAVTSGEEAFDKAVLDLPKKCASMAKKREWTEVALPARLKKLRDGDIDRIIALLGPEALDLGECAFDFERQDETGYLKEYQATLAVVGARILYLVTLVRLAMSDSRGEAHVRTILPRTFTNHRCAAEVIQVLIACGASNDTLALAVNALEIEGDWREVHMCWLAAAKAAVMLGPAAAFDRLERWIVTPRAKAVAEALSSAEAFDPRWSAALLPLAANGHELALNLLVRLPPDAGALDAMSAHLAREVAQTGFMFSQYAFDYLVEHADADALTRMTEGIRGAVENARSGPD